MRIDPILQKVEIVLVSLVAAAFVLGTAFLAETPVSVHDFVSTDVTAAAPASSPRGSVTTTQQSQPAILEPGLRVIDVAANHG